MEPVRHKRSGCEACAWIEDLYGPPVISGGKHFFRIGSRLHPYPDEKHRAGPDYEPSPAPLFD